MSERLLKQGISVFLVIFIMLTGLFINSCGAKDTGDNKLVVAVSILPQAGFVKAIGGEKVEVVVMVPPEASPHTYEVTPDQMTQLSKAKIYAKVGSPVEFELAWMDKLTAVNKSMLVVDCAKGIELMETAEEEHEHEHEAIEEEAEHEHEGLDPHIWLSARNVQVMARNIYDGLVQVDPANKEYYTSNYNAYINELKGLDEEITGALSRAANRRFIVFHPAFGYFARDYGLEQIAVEQGGKEPDADYLVRLIEEAKEYNIKVIFVSSQYSTKSAESVAKEIGGKVVIIDPLAEDFTSNMRNIAEAIKEAMQ